VTTGDSPSSDRGGTGLAGRAPSRPDTEPDEGIQAMDHTTNSMPVYHDGQVNGETSDEEGPGFVIEAGSPPDGWCTGQRAYDPDTGLPVLYLELLLRGAPRAFMLTTSASSDEIVNQALREHGLGEIAPAVVGMECGNAVLTVARNPFTGRWTHGTHPTIEDAVRLYSRFSPLELVYT
jgi:hypothetical protein